MPWDTGLSNLDAESDFQRARRRQVLARLARRLRGEPDDINLILPFDEVVAAVGRAGERRLGLETIELRTIVIFGPVQTASPQRLLANAPSSEAESLSRESGVREGLT